MYGLAVNLSMSVSGHPWIIDEMSAVEYKTQHYNTLVRLYEVWRVSQLNKIVVSKQNQSKCVNCQNV